MALNKCHWCIEEGINTEKNMSIGSILRCNDGNSPVDRQHTELDTRYLISLKERHIFQDLILNLNCSSKPKLHSNREERRFEACDEVTLKDLDFPDSSWAFYWKQCRDLKENTAQDNQWFSHCGSALPRAPGMKPGLVKYLPDPTGQWWACKRRHRTSPAHVDRNHKGSLSWERFSSTAAKEAN